MSEETKPSREFLGSRLGFILLSAGCAIGLGNIWRFPYITGQYGGALFVCFYLIFLFLLGFPAMVMELSIGRGSRQCLVGCFRTLKPADSRIPWVGLGKLFFAGNLVLLMFYSVITGWLLSYTYDYLVGIFNHLQPDDIGTVFGLFLGNYMRQILFTFIALGITTAICISGLKSGVERCTKFMMAVPKAEETAQYTPSSFPDMDQEATTTVPRELTPTWRMILETPYMADWMPEGTPIPSIRFRMIMLIFREERSSL